MSHSRLFEASLAALLLVDGVGKEPPATAPAPGQLPKSMGKLTIRAETGGSAPVEEVG
jgi:hypothetical protein